jgi:DNA-binding MarR family transcriptional regulator
MELLEKETDSQKTEAICAALLMEVVLLVMRAIRAEMRRHRDASLSVPQFRALAFLSRHPEAALSEVAEHLGLTLPATSKLIDGLVDRGLVIRNLSPIDRRFVALALTEVGRSTLDTARRATQVCLAQKLTALSPSERATVTAAMDILRPIFAAERSPSTERRSKS